MEGVSTSEEEDYQYTDGDNIITEKKQSVEELETIGLGKYKKYINIRKINCERNIIFNNA